MISTFFSDKRGRDLILLLAVLALTACGGGGNSTASPGDNAIVNTSSNSAQSNDQPVSGSETGGSSASASTFPFAGTFVADEYSPGFSPVYEGIVEIVPSPLTKTRVLSGSMPRRYPDGRTTYRAPCGQRVTQIVIADRSGAATPLTPCSSNIPNDGASPTDFRQSSLSPDGTKLAVEARAYINSGYSYSTLVFDTATQEILATWTGAYNGTWTPAGRLLLASDTGMFLLDANLDNPQKLGDNINGIVGNPDVDPTGASVVFEFNQQIWGMDLDSTEARALITAGSYLRFPTWDPNGSASITYLSLPSDDKYLTSIFATDLSTGQSYALSLAPVLEFGDANYLRTINGPLSWNQ